jgi:membrane protease YdiL (CAAX protease family)
MAFAWTLGAASCLLWLARLGVALRPSSATDIVQIGAIEALVFVLGMTGILALHGREAPLGASLGLRPTHAALFVLGLALGFAAHFPAEAVDTVVRHFAPESAEDVAAESALIAAGSPPRLVLVLFVVACVGPLVEELFFRGALFGALRQSHSLFGATATTAACFVVGHLNYRRWPALVVVSVVLSHLRAVSGSLLPSLAMHVAFNAVTVLAFFVGGSAEAEPMGLIPMIAGTAATALLVIAVQRIAARVDAAKLGRLEDAG